MIIARKFRLISSLIFGCFIVSSAFAESGRSDYDLDDDGLIEINDLADLDEIRNKLTGTSLYGENTGCPATDGCHGFELTTNLDFDTNTDGVMDENDDYWNDGAGWNPIGTGYSKYSATLNGNGFEIRNLYINRSKSNYVGLFSAISGSSANITNIKLTGSLMSITGSSYVGSLVGEAGSSAIISHSSSTGAVSGSYDVGGLVGRLSSSSSLTHSFATGTVVGIKYYVGGLVGSIISSSSIKQSFASGSVDGYSNIGGIAGLSSLSSTIDNCVSMANVTGTSYTGGLIGYADSVVLNNTYSSGEVVGSYRVGGLLGYSTNSSTNNSYWAIDSSNQDISSESNIDTNYVGATFTQLRCPTSADNTSCLEGSALFSSWDESIWDFGDNTQLPGLIIDGEIYRDSDADGILDRDDAFPNNKAAALDSDLDGHPNEWMRYCDADCIAESGLTLDQFPTLAAAWQDDDLDGYTDSWSESCDQNCQDDSGLILDVYPLDTDNDGISDVEDNDDGNDGEIDADADSDGLIDISTLEQLNAIRYNLDGTGRVLTENGIMDSSGCPVVVHEGISQHHCSGYELTNTLDFDTNADGIMDANDDYWNDGAGWTPIARYPEKFSSILDGQGYQIRNLFINFESGKRYVGLFGYVSGKSAQIRNLGLTGPLMSITGGVSVGSFAGELYASASITNSYSTGSVNADWISGGLAGAISYATISNCFNTGEITVGLAEENATGGLVGYSFDSIISNSFSTVKVNSNGLTGVGGLIGEADPDTTFNSYWATDTSFQTSSSQQSLEDGYFGVTLAQLQCPTSADNTGCIAEKTLYNTWDSNTWDFGNNNQLPGLIINGNVYRDGDGDGRLDADDAFPEDEAAYEDSDGDGHPDSWSLGCNAECIANTDLRLDQFPQLDYVWQDEDLDGYPDSWADTCDISCQQSSGLRLDNLPNDTDNDSIPNSEDSDDNNDGYPDADNDSDGLIEISSLEQLNAMRYNLSGSGRVLSEGGISDNSGCPLVFIEGRLQQHCSGYELTTDLDFDTNDDGVMDNLDIYWNSGEGWEPIGSAVTPFTGIFNGNGHTINNLFINRESEEFVGLFGAADQYTAHIYSVILAGNLMNITGDWYTGSLVGLISNSATVSDNFITGTVTANSYAGGLIGAAANSIINNNYTSVTVSSQEGTGGLVGGAILSEFTNNVVMGSVNGEKFVGGLIGYAEYLTITNSYAMGAVYGTEYVGGLMGDSVGATVTNSYWITDTTGQDTSAEQSEESGYFGISLSDLQCPTSGTDSNCTAYPSLFENWDDAVWDFITPNQLPGLTINGVIYRDTDFDGVLDHEDDDDDNDNILDANDAFPFDKNEDTDTDGDGIGDNQDQDDDNDGVEDSIDPSNDIDNGLPEMLTVGDDIKISANEEDGTAVYLNFDELTSALSALDAVDASSELTYKGSIKEVELVSDENGFVKLPTGRLVINWIAIDTTGNQSLPMEQVISVYPQLRFAETTSTIGEASTAVIVVELSGESPEYPVNVKLSFNANDSTVTVPDLFNIDLNESQRTIVAQGSNASINRQSLFAVTTIDDYLAEDDEQLIINIEGAILPEGETNYFLIDGTQGRHELTITDTNLRPDVSILVRQNGEETSTVVLDGGDITLEALITDGNGKDNHTIKWGLGYVAGVDTSERLITISTDDLVEGNYKLSVTVTDDATIPLSNKMTMTLPVIKANSSPENPSNTDSRNSSGSGGGALNMYWLLLITGLFYSVRRRKVD